MVNTIDTTGEDAVSTQETDVQYCRRELLTQTGSAQEIDAFNTLITKNVTEEEIIAYLDFLNKGTKIPEGMRNPPKPLSRYALLMYLDYLRMIDSDGMPAVSAVERDVRTRIQEVNDLPGELAQWHVQNAREVMLT